MGSLHRGWAAQHGFKAYAFNHQCEIMDNEGTGCALLVDISPYGARLKMHGAARGKMLRPGHRLTLNACTDRHGEETGQIPCRVDWSEGDECGVVFGRDLRLTASELQALFRG